ncbi:16S rRNA pseudouridine(516) synthase, partial [Burkholderia pseudomallei]
AKVRHPLVDAQIYALRAGVLMHGEPKPVAALSAVARGERLIEMTIDEGKYLLVKRIVAAESNRFEALHRSRIGGFALPD